MERVPFVTNFRMASQQHPCLLLVGLTELHRRLKMAVHASLASASSSSSMSTASPATNSNPTSPTACTWPAASCPCLSPPPSRLSSRPPAASRWKSTGWPISPTLAPPSPRPAPSPASISSRPARNCSDEPPGQPANTLARARRPRPRRRPRTARPPARLPPRPPQPGPLETPPAPSSASPAAASSTTTAAAGASSTSSCTPAAAASKPPGSGETARRTARGAGPLRQARGEPSRPGVPKGASRPGGLREQRPGCELPLRPTLAMHECMNELALLPSRAPFRTSRK